MRRSVEGNDWVPSFGQFSYPGRLQPQVGVPHDKNSLRKEQTASSMSAESEGGVHAYHSCPRLRRPKSHHHHYQRLQDAVSIRPSHQQGRREGSAMAD